MGERATLANGRVVEVTAQNWRDLAREDNEAFSLRGGDQAAAAERVINFQRLAGLDTSYFAAPGVGARASAERVTGNPLVRVSDAIYGAVPAGAQQVWQDARTFAIEKGEDVLDALKALPESANLAAGASTVRVVAISAAVVAVALAGAYAVRVFK